MTPFLQSVKTVSEQPCRTLQTIRRAQAGVHLPNKIFIQAVNKFLKHLRYEKIKVCLNFQSFKNQIHRYLQHEGTKDTIDKDDKLLLATLSTTTGMSLERSLEDM